MELSQKKAKAKDIADDLQWMVLQIKKSVETLPEPELDEFIEEGEIAIQQLKEKEDKPWEKTKKK